MLWLPVCDEPTVAALIDLPSVMVEPALSIDPVRE